MGAKKTNKYPVIHHILIIDLNKNAIHIFKYSQLILPLQATVTIDEGHRIKNENAVLREFLNRIRCPFRLLLTGTPLQNNLHELWALLNYIVPDVFKDSSVFDEGAAVEGNSLNQKLCTKARKLLQESMMIRRVKRDVEKSLLPKIYRTIYVPLTDLQTRWYGAIVNSREYQTTELSLVTMNQLLHTLSQLWKVVNHPKQIISCRVALRKKEEARVRNAQLSGSEFVKFRSDLKVNQIQYKIFCTITHSLNCEHSHARICIHKYMQILKE